MSNADRILGKRAEKPMREPRIKKLKVNFDALPDAIVDGKLVVPIKGRIVFMRELDQRKAETHEGFVFSYDEKTGHVDVWDETRGQFWGFNAVADAANVVCKALSAPPGTT